MMNECMVNAGWMFRRGCEVFTKVLSKLVCLILSES